MGALGLIGGGILTAFAKQFTFGDGKEIRQELREELKRLREERGKDQEELDELREDVRVLRAAMEDQRTEQERQIRDLRLQIERLTTRNQHYLITRTEARALLNALERRQGLVETPWAADPLEGT
ncbi:hypothetical protein DEIPH_ctg062orf0001 [Deinococcus phoenicis]|uniref:Uncharacterized protein n=2 Tax=Deinococcus phoenicis TaxID=1476583 RepID=A0A016QLQ2_9DEIO|nr:hypothetical protein DEIPH_ctg062orf0001 [Deinococcus phoenicis]